jgi:hypothetical protein
VRRLVPLHWLLANGDAVPRQHVALVVTEPAGTIGAEHDVAAPARQLERQPVASTTPTVDRERQLTQLPGVAVRTVKDALPVEILQAGKVRHVVHDTRCQQQAPRGECAAIFRGHFEPGWLALHGADNLDRLVPDGVVPAELFVRQPPQFGRRRAVPRDEAVKGVAEAVAAAVLVEEEHATARPRENECRAQSRGSRADNDDVRI